MFKAHGRNRFCDIGRLFKIKGVGLAGFHVAERTSPRAGIAHDHHGCVLLAPALTDIRAAGFLTHGDKAVFFHDGAGLFIDFPARCTNADPFRLAHHDAIRPFLLFGVARGALGLGVDERNHRP